VEEEELPPGSAKEEDVMPSEPQLIDIKKIQLDLSNYRTGKQQSWQDSLRAMIEEQGQRLVKLAQHILDHGFNPLESLAVVPAADGGTFVAVEGNRRVTVQRLLHDPLLAKRTAIEQQITKLSKRKDNLPSEVRCVIFESKAEAYVWTRLKHDVGWAGEATVPWTRIARLRAAADQGQNPPAHDVLEFVMSKDVLDETLGERLAGHDFPVSTLERLLESPSVRNELGLKLGGEHLLGRFDKRWTLAVLAEIIRAIGEERFEGEPFTVRNINTVEQQKTFVQKLLKMIPRPSDIFTEWPIFADTDMTQQEKPAEAGDKTTSERPKPPGKKPQKSNPHSTDRKHLVDGRCPIKPPTGRANDILWELKKLDIEKFTNAVSILFRVFLELSVERYVGKHKVTLPPDAKLRPKVQAVVSDMKKKGLMTDFKAVNVAVGTPDSVVSISTLHAYVHHPTFHPSPKELKVAWDRLQEFIVTLWQS
jgi:hypothetical protein